MKTTRQLTHALLYDEKTDSWSCKCGYKLGDGHHALYAVCPLSLRDKSVISNSIEQNPLVSAWGKPKRKPKPPAGLKQGNLDVFDL